MANDGRGGRVTPHPVELRERALALAADVGKQKAGDILNLSPNTIGSWQKRQSKASHAELQRRGFSLPTTRNVSWSARRSELLLGLADLASESVAAARQAVREGRSKAAQEYSSVASRAVDKCQLIGGDVTSRSESRSMSVHVDAQQMQELNAEIAALEAELDDG